MFDSKDLLILSYLRRNGRVSLTNLSKLTHIPISTLYERISKLKVIQKYTSIIDFGGLGYELNVNIMVKVRKEEKKLLIDFITKSHNINSAYVIDNHYDI